MMTLDPVMAHSLDEYFPVGPRDVCHGRIPAITAHVGSFSGTLCYATILDRVVGFFPGVLRSDTPVSKALGSVAMLSGMDKDSSNTLHGAALSGVLRKPV